MNYYLIEKVISFIPSKNLKKSYQDDILNGVYPEWTEEDCLSVINMCTHNVQDEVNCYKQVASLVDDTQIKDSIIKWANELMHQGNRYKIDKKPTFIEKYVKIKTLYKKGELVSRWWNNQKLYAVISGSDDDINGERLKEIISFMDYGDACYNCLDIGTWKVNFDNPYDIFGSHSHPMKVNVELADISKLNEKEKIYYDVIMNRYLYCDEKKVFEEYDRKHGKL